jgi:hypothetical protein
MKMLEVVVIMINNNCWTWFVDVNQYGMLLHELYKPYDQDQHHFLVVYSWLGGFQIEQAQQYNITIGFNNNVVNLLNHSLVEWIYFGMGVGESGGPTYGLNGSMFFWLRCCWLSILRDIGTFLSTSPFEELFWESSTLVYCLFYYFDVSCMSMSCFVLFFQWPTLIVHHSQNS